MKKNSSCVTVIVFLIGDFFQFDDLKNEDIENNSANDAGIISGAMNLFVNLLEKVRQSLYVS